LLLQLKAYNDLLCFIYYIKKIWKVHVGL